LYFVAGCCLGGDAIGIFLASSKLKRYLEPLHLQASLNYPQSSWNHNEFNKIGCRWNDRTCTGFAAQPNTTLLQERLNNLDVSAAQGNGHWHLDLDTGERWFHNGKQRFPMQSVFKLPSALSY